MSRNRFVSILSLFVLFIASVVLLTVYADDEAPTGTPDPSSQATIDLQGQVTAINEDTLIVNGLTVLIDDVSINTRILVGTTVQISAILQPDVTVNVTVIVQINSNRPILVVYGPVVAINVNIVTVYNIDIEFDDDDPALTVIQIGDIIRVKGKFDDDDDGGRRRKRGNRGDNDDDD